VYGTCDDGTDTSNRVWRSRNREASPSPDNNLILLIVSAASPRHPFVRQIPSDLPPPPPPHRPTTQSVFGNSVLLPLDEDATMDEFIVGSVGGRALPKRLAHLQGPTRIGHPVSRLQQLDTETAEISRGGETPSLATVALRTPPNATLTQTPNMHVVRGAHGSVFVGPWNGRWGRADGGGARDAEISERAQNEEESATRSSRAVGIELDPLDTETIAELAFCDTHELRLDDGAAVTTELISEEIITGRRTRGGDTDVRGELRLEGREIDNGEARRHRGARVNSAPAATRRVGAARVATRKRPSASFVKAKRENWKTQRAETGGAGGSGGPNGFFGGASQVMRNASQRNTMGARCLQPRGF
jgi:hypothetical protein